MPFRIVRFERVTWAVVLEIVTTVPLARPSIIVVLALAPIRFRFRLIVRASVVCRTSALFPRVGRRKGRGVLALGASAGGRVDDARDPRSALFDGFDVDNFPCGKVPRGAVLPTSGC